MRLIKTVLFTVWGCLKGRNARAVLPSALRARPLDVQNCSLQFCRTTGRRPHPPNGTYKKAALISAAILDSASRHHSLGNPLGNPLFSLRIHKIRV